MNRTLKRCPSGCGPHSRRALLALVATAAYTAILVSGPLQNVSFAQPIPLDYESHERLKANLAGRVILLEVLPRPNAFEVASLVPRRFGEGIVVTREGRPVIVTSWFFVSDALSVTALTPDGKIRVEALVEKEMPASGLAILSLPAKIAAAMSFPPATPGILKDPDRNRIFFCVSPVSPGTFVLTEAVVVDRAGPPFDSLFLAPGVLAPGTVLFDATGVPFAIAARESFSGNGFTIVAPLQAPPPSEPAAREEQPE